MANFKITKKYLDNVSNTKRNNTKGITIHSYNDWYDKKAQYGGYSAVETKNKEKADYGFNYLLDQYDIIETIKPSCVINPFIDKKLTYIATNLFDNKVAENTISICIFVSSEHDYKETEKQLIKFISSLLDKYNLGYEDIWRGFDLSQDDKGPVQYIDETIFKNLINEIEKYHKSSDKDNFEFTPSFGENVDANEEVKEIIEESKKDANYINSHEPWSKDNKKAETTNKDTSVQSMNTKTYPTKNVLQYNVTSNFVPAKHCVKAYDTINGVETEEDTYVEPIYPDLITPPGGDINIADGFSETAVQSNSNTPITVEDFEKRQQTFSMKDFENVKKTTVGRPINTDDPFPVDEQIKKLEEHYPKVKIDKTTFNFTEDNHPGSQLGPAAIKNFNMLYDMVNETSKRTEKRLVKIENNLSTVMRNLFRISSRINVNCVYYGGQSVYGKYKCIRCLHDNRVDDGAVVSLDQCLCCTRYEPIDGQVYAILDETGSNVTQVIDDMQMSFLDLNEYNTFNNINEYHDKPKNANLKKDSTSIPKEFRNSKWADTKAEKEAKEELKAHKAAVAEEADITPEDTNNILITYEEIKDYLDDKYREVVILNAYDAKMDIDEYIILHKYEFLPLITDSINKEEKKSYTDDSGNQISKEDYIKLLTKKFKDSYVNDDYYNGFKMDWRPTLLETHKANVNTYNVESLQDGKSSDVSSDHQGNIERDVFIDSRENAVEYEKLEFDIKDYTLSNFSNGVDNSLYSDSGGVFGGMGANEVRNKIVEYAKKAVDLCASGKARYSQELRQNHDDKAVNGINYWDCSSLVEAAYRAGGVTGVSGNTASEYPACLDVNGGLLIPISQMNKAIAGDIIWFYNGAIPSTQADLQNISYKDTGMLYHVGIYIGDGKYAHASGSKSVPNIKISNVKDNSKSLAFGRPKDLIELDKQSSMGVGGSGAWSKDEQGITDEYWGNASVVDGQVGLFISNMTKYGYKDALIKSCKSHNFDPYLLAAIITIESTGDPNAGSTYKGLLQCQGGSSDPATNIEQGLTMLEKRKPALINAGWKDTNMHVLVSAHNSGEGTVINAAKSGNVNLSSCNIVQLGGALYDYVKSHTSWNANEKKYYSTKVLRAYNLLKSKNALS